MPIPEKPIIHLEEGWDDLGKGIEKLKSFLEQNVSNMHKPILKAAFGELTVLGFIGERRRHARMVHSTMCRWDGWEWCP